MVKYAEIKDDVNAVNIKGKPYMFINARVDRTDIPKDMYAYDVQDGSSDGVFRRVQQVVCIDHWGTVIGFDRLKEAEEEKGYVCREPDGCFLEAYTEKEYRQDYDRLLEECAELVADTERERSLYRNMTDERLLECFFGIFDAHMNSTCSADLVMQLIRESLQAEEVGRRMDTDLGKDPYGRYLDAVRKYLSERDGIGGRTENNGRLKAMLDDVRQAEKDFKNAFLSAEYMP